MVHAHWLRIRAFFPTFLGIRNLSLFHRPSPRHWEWSSWLVLPLIALFSRLCRDLKLLVWFWRMANFNLVEPWKKEKVQDPDWRTIVMLQTFASPKGYKSSLVDSCKSSNVLLNNQNIVITHCDTLWQETTWKSGRICDQCVPGSPPPTHIESLGTRLG